MSNTARIAATAANTLTKPLNVEDVFSTYLYTGDSSTGQTITNGIDLAGEGGMVWFKTRSSANGHNIYDTERGDGVLQYITSEASITNSTNPWSPTSTGFFTGRDFGGSENQNGSTTVSWTFRKAPKFFTVVTYTGDGTSNRQISHDLGGTVGHIAVKRTDASAEFFNWHRTFSDNQLVAFTGTYAVGTYSNYLVTADSTTFTVGNNVDVNANGGTYVAYLWGHNDGDGEFGPDADQDAIKCGSYTGTGSNGNFVNLGFEPQWIMVKRTNSTGNWIIVDNMRSLSHSHYAWLYPNTSDAEGAGASSTGLPSAEATGFTLNGSSIWMNASGSTYIYIAIRRGPMAVPESATDVFAIDTQSGGGEPSFTSGFVVDMGIESLVSSASNRRISSRLTQGKALETNTTDADLSSTGYAFDYQNGWFYDGGSNADKYSWMWKRAPNYFDAVAYTGDGTNGRAISHNLGVAPEMMWVRVRNAANDWVVYHKDLGEDTILRLNSSSATISKNVFSSNTPTDSVFYVQGSAGYDVNYSSSQTYIAYLFASLPGVSKVGSYTGTGAAQDIDCGFSSGARFVLIKRTDSTSSWFVFDSERGIVSGNDPYLYLNLTNAQVTSRDGVDPLSSGFSLTTDSTFNASGGSYIFYAIA